MRTRSLPLGAATVLAASENSRDSKAMKQHKGCLTLQQLKLALRTELFRSDADKIVAAWSRYGARGLGKLSGLESDEAAQRLFDAATIEASTADGAFQIGCGQDRCRLEPLRCSRPRKTLGTRKR